MNFCGDDGFIASLWSQLRGFIFGADDIERGKRVITKNLVNRKQHCGVQSNINSQNAAQYSEIQTRHDGIFTQFEERRFRNLRILPNGCPMSSKGPLNGEPKSISGKPPTLLALGRCSVVSSRYTCTVHDGKVQTDQSVNAMLDT